MTPNLIGGHSAQVKMRLLLNGSSIPIAQMGPDFLILESATEHPPSDVTIELRIDESERRWKVRLPDGISTASPTVSICGANEWRQFSDECLDHRGHSLTRCHQNSSRFR